MLRFLLAIGFVVCFSSLGFCADPNTPGSKSSVQPVVANDKAEQDIIKQEWDKATLEKKRPQYSPSSVSVEEKVLEEKPLMVKDKVRNADEKDKEFQTKLPEIADLPKEFDALISLQGKMKLVQAIRLLSRSVNRNLIVGAGVDDKDVELNLDNVEVWRAFNTILYSAGYSFKLGGDKDIILLAVETRMFRLNLPPFLQTLNTLTTNESLEGASSSDSGSNGSGSGSSSGSSSSNGGNSNGRIRVGTKVILENKAEGLSFWGDADENLKKLVSATGTYSFNKVGGVVVVTDTPAALDRVGVYLMELNKRVSQQVLCDVKVVEVHFLDNQKTGIDWNALARNTKLGFGTNFSAQNFSSSDSAVVFSAKDSSAATTGKTTDGISGVLSALATYGKVEVVSQPRVVLLNNIVANIQVGETKSYVDSTSVETTTTGTTVTGTLSEVHGGVTLQLLANVVGDEIFLNVTPVVSTIDSIRTITLGNSGKLEAPDTSLRSINTVVKVKDGDTVAIGGLITRDKQKTSSGIPFLSRIPGLGKLFSYDVMANDRTELVVFITPKRG